MIAHGLVARYKTDSAILAADTAVYVVASTCAVVGTEPSMTIA